jgi:hypothetical protein
MPGLLTASRLHSSDADHRRPNEKPLENSRSERQGITSENKGGRIMNCPDCGKEIKEVIVERFQIKKFTVNHETKEITPFATQGWENNDYAYHCSECDSLNVDELLSKYKLKEE